MQKHLKTSLGKKNDGQKGCYVEYEELEMASYLMSKSNISVKDKIEMFAIRCEMNELPYNYGKKENCEMGCQAQEMNNKHILDCPKLNGNLDRRNIMEILNGNNQQKVKTFNKFKENMERRKSYLRDSV